MHDFMALIERHGYLLVSSIVFAEAVGLPVPAAIGLVGAGAAAASGILHPGLMLLSVLLSMMAGDALLFVLGRYTRWALLGVLCRVSVNPETCILRSAESFYKRGKATLIIAKFIPGINTMAPPLAGSMRMRPWQFVRLDFLGASLYILAYFGVGYVFRDFLATITHGLQTAGRAMEEVLLLAIIGYAVYRIWLYRKNSVYRVVPRIQVEELARRLASENESNVLIADVRSHGYYDPGAARIKGSVRLEPNNLAEELKNFPKDKDIYLYCT